MSRKNPEMDEALKWLNRFCIYIVNVNTLNTLYFAKSVMPEPVVYSL